MVLNTLYSDPAIIRKARDEYLSNNPHNIRLQNFFQPALFTILQKKLALAKYTAQFNPNKYRYQTTHIKEIDAFLQGPYFVRIIQKLLSIETYTIRYEIRKFDAGNYTLLHDTEHEDPGVDFVIDFSKTNKHFGGRITYLTEREELLQLNPCPNSLAVIHQEKGMIKYTKYVTHQQKTPLIFVVGTILKTMP